MRKIVVNKLILKKHIIFHMTTFNIVIGSLLCWSPIPVLQRDISDKILVMERVGG